MNLYCSKLSKFTKTINIKIKPETDGKINLYSCFIKCLKKFETIPQVEISWVGVV